MNFLVAAVAWYEAHQPEIATAVEAVKALKPALAEAVALVKVHTGK